MMGYVPFLGQVRLVTRFRLGQEGPLRTRTEWIQLLSQRQGLLAGRPECDPAGEYKKVVERAITWINSEPGEGEFFTPSDEEKIVEKAFLECALRSPSTPTPQAGPVTVKPYEEAAVPTWAWIGGGVAAAALIALLATR